ncbi:MAG: hypothetical protein CMJ81_03675 [Planctomycetaceae bacterium]|jgi:hypothetical protein|nr:hypothetical protein [Planctomycetaceae bacterium]MBP61315.1 hypothetical protein [Planctomycetaceae bacterium]
MRYAAAVDLQANGYFLGHLKSCPVVAFSSNSHHLSLTGQHIIQKLSVDVPNGVVVPGTVLIVARPLRENATKVGLLEECREVLRGSRCFGCQLSVVDLQEFCVLHFGPWKFVSGVLGRVSVVSGT